MSEIIKDMDDKELYDALEKAGLVEKLESQPEWAMLKEAASRIVERSIAEFALRTDSKDMHKIVMLQTIIKKYKFAIFDEIRMLKSESNAIFEEARERGIIGNLFDKVFR